MDTIDIIEKYKLFWQYPVITEKEFYQQNKHDDNYLGFPWATVIDKRYNLDVIYKILAHSIKDKKYYTCVQHISFRKIIPLLKALNVTCIYSPHKVKGEDFIETIELKPCPLYAVNIEDNSRNQLFEGIDFEDINRPLLYSFQGAYDNRWYLSDIRQQIFNMNHPDNCFINRIGHWHFEHVVYSKLQNNSYILNENDSDIDRTNKYNKLLLDSRFSLCPSGTGPNSIRFWESLASGSIPVLLADTLELSHNVLWKEAIIILQESELLQLPNILANISDEKERMMRKNCIKLYNYYTNNFKNDFVNVTYDNKPTIFTSYLCDVRDDIVQYILRSWKSLNPDFNVLYFSDKDVEAFFKDTDYYETYKKMKNGVAIADFFRICYINKYGGYWFDIDIKPSKLNVNIEENIHLFDCGFGNISYMFIGGRPNQKLFEEVIKQVEININNNIPIKTQHVMEITGPRIIQNIIFTKMNIRNIDGCLKGTTEDKKYLEHTDYEFLYSLVNFVTTKTDEYKDLQHRYQKMNYQNYNYI